MAPAKKKVHKGNEIEYTHKDADGIRWRFKGARPISEIADECNNFINDREKEKK